jgi:hypothetical protein
MTDPLLIRRNGMVVDHLAVGVPDTKEGMAWIAELTGAEPFIATPEPGQFYWSGGLSLGDGCFLEVLGPNPEFSGFNPMLAAIRGFRTPRPIFWYVGTTDFDAFSSRARAAGAPVERVQAVRHETEGRTVDYRRGVLGPGFRSERPCVIQWLERTPRDGMDDRCRLLRLGLRSPISDRLNAQFAALGIDVPVEQGPASLRIELATPKGTVTLEGEGFAAEQPWAMFLMSRLYLTDQLRRLRRRASVRGR